MSTREAILAGTDYEPYDKRDAYDQTGRINTLVNLVKANLGTGVLAMPQAFLHAGLLIGSVGVVLITILLTFSLHLLFDSMYFIAKRDQIPQTTYPNAFKEGLLIGPKCMRKCAGASPYVVNFFIIVYQFGIMCIYIVFYGATTKQLVDYYTDKRVDLSLELYMTAWLLPALILTLLKSLKYLAPISNVANWLTILALFCIYYFCFEKVEPIGDRRLFPHITTLPLFIGTAMFSNLALGPALEIELNMKNPRYWRGTFGILSQGMALTGFIGLITGFFGYWKYGDHTESVITLNINIDHYLAQAIRILFCLAIFLSYPLQAFPVHQIIWTQYVEEHMQRSSHKLLWNYILRTITVLLSYLIAVFVPYLGLFMSLCGTFCLSILCVIFPALLDICVRWPDDFGKAKILFVRDILLIFCGFICWTSGTCVAVKEIAAAAWGDMHK